jgi:glycosyltransferase involved in cell wall biosynthesis
MAFGFNVVMNSGSEAAPRADVIILTKNSMEPSLPGTIASVYASIPVNRLIVVDGGSTDGTVDYLSKQEGVFLIDDSNGDRATARQKGIENVQTEYFAFVDSDMVLQRDWYLEALALMLPKVGAISTYPRYFGTAERAQRALEKMYGRPTRRRFDTAAALLRTSAVRGIQIPSEDEQVASEDEFIGRVVQKRGYEVLCVGRPVAYHRESPHLVANPDLRADLIRKGRLLRAKGWRSSRYMARQFLVSVPESLFILAYTGSFTTAWQRFRYSALSSAGYFAAPHLSEVSPG